MLIAKYSLLSPSLGITLSQRELPHSRSHSLSSQVHIQWFIYEGTIKIQHPFFKIDNPAPKLLIGSPRFLLQPHQSSILLFDQPNFLHFLQVLILRASPNKFPPHKSLSQSISQGTQLKTYTQEEWTSWTYANWGIKIQFLTERTRIPWRNNQSQIWYKECTRILYQKTRKLTARSKVELKGIRANLRRFPLVKYGKFVHRKEKEIFNALKHIQYVKNSKFIAVFFKKKKRNHLWRVVEYQHIISKCEKYSQNIKHLSCMNYILGELCSS